MDQFSYFALRLHRHDESAAEPGLEGVIQLLSTGEKRAFTGIDELVVLLQHWPTGAIPKLRADLTREQGDRAEQRQ